MHVLMTLVDGYPYASLTYGHMRYCVYILILYKDIGVLVFIHVYMYDSIHVPMTLVDGYPCASLAYRHRV